MFRLGWLTRRVLCAQQGEAPGCTLDRLATAECKSIPLAGGCRTLLPRGPSSDCLDSDADAPFNFLAHGAFSRCLEVGKT